MITILGASGYTGQRIAAELDQSGIIFRLAGRSEARLKQLSASLSSKPAYFIADVKKPATLNKLAEGTMLIINCAGPFTDLGEPIVSLAALHGIHYLDITNELGFVYRMQSYTNLARSTGAIIIPACGFEVAFSDCGARLAAAGMEPCERILITYLLAGRGISVGTRRSALRSVATSWLAYRNGGITGAVPITWARQVNFEGKYFATIHFPSSETVTIPSHTQVEEIRTTLVVSRLSAAWLPILAPIGAWGLQTLKIGQLLDWVASTLPAQPTPRQDAPFKIKVTAASPANTRTLYLTGNGVYEMTARIIAYAAQQILRPSELEGGVYAPSAVLSPGPFLSHVSENWGIAIRMINDGLESSGNHA